MAYCFMSIEKIKSPGVFTRKYEHNYRTSKVPNADKERLHLNEEIVKLPDGKTYIDAYRDKMMQIGHTPRSNAVLGLEIVMTYNPSEVDENFDIDKWKEANVKWLKENFPPDCILSVVMHRDEGPTNGKAAHLHAIVLPVHENKLNCKHYLSGRVKMVQLQDSYGKAMKPLGLERGMKGSCAKHEDIRRFYDSLNKAIDMSLPEPEEYEEVDAYFERANKHFQQINIKKLEQTKKLERQIVELKTQIKMANYDEKTQLSQERKKIEEEKRKLKYMEDRLKEKEESIQLMETKTKNLNYLLEGLKHHPDVNLTSALKEDIQMIIEWEKEQEEKRNSEEFETEEDI